MTIKLGDKSLVNFKVGTSQVQKIYKGTVLVWSLTTSPIFNPDGSVEMGSGGQMEDIDDVM